MSAKRRQTPETCRVVNLILSLIPRAPSLQLASADSYEYGRGNVVYGTTALSDNNLMSSWNRILRSESKS